MQTKPLLFGLVGFFIGGLLVSVAATTFDKPSNHIKTGELSMSQMTDSLRNKQGDNFDKAFIEHMISHHEAAIDMAALSNKNAKHDELKKLSEEIISTQKKEVDQMKDWQKMWGYESIDHSSMGH